MNRIVFMILIVAFWGAKELLISSSSPITYLFDDNTPITSTNQFPNNNINNNKNNINENIYKNFVNEEKILKKTIYTNNNVNEVRKQFFTVTENYLKEENKAEEEIKEEEDEIKENNLQNGVTISSLTEGNENATNSQQETEENSENDNNDNNTKDISAKCSSEFDKYGGIFVYILFVLYCFVGLAILCEGEFKDSIVMLSAVLKLSPDVAGATLMAAGTSSPELFTALVAVFSPVDDIGTGTIVGSAIFNILIIIGLCAVLSSFQFNLDWKPVTRDIIVNIISFIYLYISFRDNYITLVEALVGVGIYVGYVFVLAFNDKLMSLMKKISEKLTVKIKFLKYFCYENDDPEIISSPSSSNIIIDTLDDDNNNINNNININLSPYNPLHLLRDNSSDDINNNNDNNNEDHFAIQIDNVINDNNNDNNNNNVRERISIELDPILTLEEREEEDRKKREKRNKEIEKEEEERREEEERGEEEEEEIDFEEQIKRNRKKRSSDKFQENELNDSPNSISHHPFHHFKNFSSKSRKDQIWIIITFPYEIIYYYTIPRVKGRFKYQYILSFFMSLFWLAFLSICMVKSAEKVGCILHIDDAVMGITILAVGTSLPDCLASIAVAKTGRGNMAVCNALGSNIFDILIALCLPWVLSICIYRQPIHVGSDTLVEDVIILFLTLSCFYFALIVTKWKLGRRVGYFLVVLYCFFIGYTILRELGIVVLLKDYFNPPQYMIFSPPTPDPNN